jgi:hypothetical protein
MQTGKIFDEVNVKYDILSLLGLSASIAKEDILTLSFITNDAPAKSLDIYEIREDGSLWHESYELSDRKGLKIERINKKWESVDFNGKMKLTCSFGTGFKKYLEFFAKFIDGKIYDCELLKIK